MSGFLGERQDFRASLPRGLQEIKHEMEGVMGPWTGVTGKHLQKSLKLPPPPHSSLSKKRKESIRRIRNRSRHLGVQCHLHKTPAKRLSHWPTPVQWPPHRTGKVGKQSWFQIPCVGRLILHESMNLHFSNLPQMKELPLPPQNIWMLPGGPQIQMETSGYQPRGRTGWHLNMILQNYSSKSIKKKSVALYKSTVYLEMLVYFFFWHLHPWVLPVAWGRDLVLW